MVDIRQRKRVSVVVCLAVFVGALSASTTGCIRKKKTEPSYGPGHEWVTDMRDRIQKQVDDPEKVTGLLAVVDQIELTLIDMDNGVQDYYATLRKLDRDYNASRADFEKTIDDFNTKRQEYFEKMLDHTMTMRSIAGREYWKKLSDIDKSLYDSWQRAYKPR